MKNIITGVKIRFDKRYFLYAGAAAWFFVLFILLLYLFLPYQKLMRLAFHNFLCGSKMVVSIEGARIYPMSARASKAVFGHEALMNKPLFEIEKIKVGWNPLSLFKGSMGISSDATAYAGAMKMKISGIPVIAGTTPRLSISITGADLAGYPEGRLPWFKGVTGTLKGWIRKDISLFAPEKQKGSFSFSLKNGEIKEIAFKSLPRLNLEYKEIFVEGKIDGDSINFTRIVINGPTNTIKGAGRLVMGEYEQKIDMKLAYEATTKKAPLSGKGVITISGDQWSPEIAIKPAAAKTGR